MNKNIKNGLYLIDNDSIHRSICGTYAIINGVVYKNNLCTTRESIDSVLDDSMGWIWEHYYHPKDFEMVMYELTKLQYNNIDHSYMLYEWKTTGEPATEEDLFDRWEGALYKFNNKLAFIIKTDNGVFIHREDEERLREITPEDMTEIKSSTLEKIVINE